MGEGGGAAPWCYLALPFPLHPPADTDSDTARPWVLNSSPREILHETATHSRLAADRSREEWRVTASGHELSAKGDENVVKLWLCNSKNTKAHSPFTCYGM